MKTSILIAQLLAGAIAVIPVAAAAQAPQAPVTAYKAPRTFWKQPELEGVWTNASLTQLERAAEFGDRATLTPEEAAKVEGAEAAHVVNGNKPTDPNAPLIDPKAVCGRGGQTGADCGYNTAWTDPGSRVTRVNGQPRTSFVTIPANGRVPSLTPKGQENIKQLLIKYRGPKAFDNPETRSNGERCLMSFGYSAGPVMLPLLYNNNYQVVQTKDEVAISVEMVHDVRHIRLGAKHRTDGVRTWMGDSIGRWEGDTLVVETVGFHPLQNLRGSSENLKVTERLTRVGDKRLHYAFWVEDPTVFTKPWGGEYEFTPSDGVIYEYACHEGNYGLHGVLSGAREQEKNPNAPAPTAPAAEMN